MTWTSRAGGRRHAVEMYHAIEGGQQTLDNLAALVIETPRKGVED